LKTVIITGANSGIGKSTAMQLAAKGWQVLFLARDPQKACDVKNEIIAATGNDQVDFVTGDLLSLSEVRKSAELIKKKVQKIDVLINNAGVCLPERKFSIDGFEHMFQINHLSHFLLTHLLLDHIKKSDEPRIINVSSAGHKMGKFDLENLQSEKKFGSFTTYCDTKLLNILYTFELAGKLEGTGITVNVLHPGVVSTNFAGEFKGVFGFLNKIFKPFLISPVKGAETSVYLASSEEVKGVTAKYFEKCRVVEPEKRFITPANQKILWEESERLSGIMKYC
jgi:NAD(P)-dependent dehydrogenase (short-subunit alcohol dehydrogenase family)